MNTLNLFYIFDDEQKHTRMDISLLGAAIATGIAGIGGSFITALFLRPLNEAKVKNIISDTYDQLVSALTSEVKSLREEVERLRKRIDHLSEKELKYMEHITELTKERNALQLIISDKETKIHDLEKQILKAQKSHD